MIFEILKHDLNIDFDKKKQKEFLEYIDLFRDYNSHTNLISKNDERLLFEKHIFDSFAINLFFEKYKIPKKILDIGTGGGFPSIPMAFLLDESEIWAVDSVSKKVRFLETVKKEFSLSNFYPKACRIEELHKGLKNGFDVVTTRALGNLPMILEYAVPYLKVGGYFVAFKSLDSENELKNAQNAMKILNAEYVETIEYKLPLKENFERKLLIFRKTKECSDAYPRKNGLIKKCPL